MLPALRAPGLGVAALLALQVLELAAAPLERRQRGLNVLQELAVECFATASKRRLSRLRACHLALQCLDSGAGAAVLVLKGLEVLSEFGLHGLNDLAFVLASQLLNIAAVLLSQRCNVAKALALHHCNAALELRMQRLSKAVVLLSQLLTQRLEAAGLGMLEAPEILDVSFVLGHLAGNLAPNLLHIVRKLALQSREEVAALATPVLGHAALLLPEGLDFVPALAVVVL
mmetsp:Transcript_48224/g.153958  ORF Transcript_48224/g.153958 Transcript_48224/m.153958 type:complete len:229 (-) Transcript_48224:722-1408(-)